MRDGYFLYVADEDNAQLHRVGLPLGSAPPQTVDLPGPPAQLTADGNTVWVTIRQPSMLWIGKLEQETLKEAQRIRLPQDAWGLALNATRTQALVTSAWASRVSLVDLQSSVITWSKPTAREPRGVAMSADGNWALVSHVVGSAITRVMLQTGETQTVDLPASPLRSPSRPLPASLGYAGVLSPEGDRYFVARHALGALGKNAWFGATTVDVLDVASSKPVLPLRPKIRVSAKSELAKMLVSGGDVDVPGSAIAPVTQPRAMLYRRSTRTLLVAGEGDDRVAELDALALDPTMAVMTQYQVGEDYHPNVHVAKYCAAPTGLALSDDERLLWVYCRATNDLVPVTLKDWNHSTDTNTDAGTATTAAITGIQLTPDKLGPFGATGRKLFYNATDHTVSGGLGCAGCHPEGRDDGHTWHEATFTTEDGTVTNFLGASENIPKEAKAQGFARRTPMLAGRVSAKGPYGWHAESASITDRERAGFGLHRWGAPSSVSEDLLNMRASAVSDFLRRGLTPPTSVSSQLTEEQEQGKQIFLRKEVGCAECHVPSSGYTTRKTFPLPLLPAPVGFDQDPNPQFKIPDLRFLAGRAPYFHDGSAATLEHLVENNGTRMGNTAQLTPEERAQLVAYLKTL